MTFTTFTPSFMDELKSRADIVSVVSEHVVLRKMGRSHKGLCPFHKEKTPSFTVRADPPVFHCFGCGAGGDVVEFVKLKEGLSFKDAIESLARRFGVAIPGSRAESPEDRMRGEIEPVLEAAASQYEQVTAFKIPGRPDAKEIAQEKYRQTAAYNAMLSYDKLVKIERGVLQKTDLKDDKLVEENKKKDKVEKSKKVTKRSIKELEEKPITKFESLASGGGGDY